MPKKKLTKTQVKGYVVKLINALYNLQLDKMGHPDSLVPISEAKLSELRKTIFSAEKRMK